MELGNVRPSLAHALHLRMPPPCPAASRCIHNPAMSAKLTLPAILSIALDVSLGLVGSMHTTACSWG